VNKSQKQSQSQEQPQRQSMSIVDILFQNLDVRDIIKKWNRVRTARQPWEQKWQMIQDMVMPNYRDFLSNAGNVSLHPQTNKIRNHSSSVSGRINKVVSQMNSQLTDPSIKWLDLKFIDPCYLANGMPISISGFDSAKRWLYSLKESLYNLFSDPSSNFYPSTYSFHFDWFTIGTACREIVLRKDTGKIHFNAVSMQNIYVELSGHGDISTIYRRFLLSPKQAYDLWGDRLHPTQLQLVAQSINDSARHNLHEYVEVSQPNPLKNQIPSPDYMTCVIDVMNKHVADIGLHKQSPYIVSRFDVAPNEIYGRSYTWYAMPTIITLSKLDKRAIQIADYSASPPILVKDTAALAIQYLAPDTMVQGLDANGRPTMMQMPITGNFPLLMEFYRQKLDELDEALVARDIFSQESPNMTATEVNERKIQASNRLRPILVRLEHEDLNNMVHRSLSLLSEIGMLPAFPYAQVEEELGVQEGMLQQLLPDPLSQLRIVFSGPMARMQRMQDVQNSELLFQKTMQAAQVDPSVLDKINLENIISMDAEIYGVDPQVINPPEVVQQIRAQRAEQESRQAEEQAKTADSQRQAMLIDTMIKARNGGIDIGVGA